MLEIGSVWVEDWKVALSTQDKWSEMHPSLGWVQSQLGELTSMHNIII